MGLLDLLALSFGYTKNNLNVPVNVRTDANANLNANAYIQPGAFTGQANVDAIGMQTGAVQANANVQPGAFAGQANVDALGMQTGAVQANANIQPGAFAGQANVDALGMQTGAVQMNASIQPRAFAGQANVVGMQTGAFQTTGVAPNGIQVNTNTDQIAMLFMSLGSMAVAITALGGVSMYPWVFLGSLVIAGLFYANLKQRQRAQEAQIQSSRQLTINFIHNQYQTAATNYITLVNPHQKSEIGDVRVMISNLEVHGKNMTSLFNDTVFAVQSSNDPSVFEVMKNKYCNDVYLFQQKLANQGEKIKARLYEEEGKIQKMQRIANHKSKLLKNEIRYKAIIQSIPSKEHAIDFEKMEKDMGLLKIEAKWDEYLDSYDSLIFEYQMSQDSSQEHQNIEDFANLFFKFSNSFDNLEVRVKEIKEKYEITDEGRLARSMKLKSEPLPNPHLRLQNYSLPKQLTYENKQNHYRQYNVGDSSVCPDPFIPKKVIIMTGMTGAGKSLMINNIVNYVYGVACEDDFRFKLILEADELADRTDGSTDVAESMTRFVTSYRLNYQKGFRVKYSLILIDTPGFGDTRGLDFDQKIVGSLKAFFNNREGDCIDELSSLGLVIQASQSKITAEQMYIFSSVLQIFGHDVAKNICLLFTFADAQPPPAMETVDNQFKKEGIRYDKDDASFKFNNSAVFAQNTDDEATKYYWKFGFESLKKFFQHVESIAPASLTLTKQVLDERATLHQKLNIMQVQMDTGFNKLTGIESMATEIMKINGGIKANRNHKIKKPILQQTTRVANHNITNCKVCNFTCHEVCYIPGDQKEGCASMTDGKCIHCPGKCAWTAHENGDRIFVYTKVVIEETIENMLNHYKICVDDKEALLKLLKVLVHEYFQQKTDLFDNIKEARCIGRRLDEIALGKGLLTDVVYITQLIRSEEGSSRPNKANRIQQLQNFLKKAQLLDDAKNNKLQKEDNLTKFEATVMKAIEKAAADADSSFEEEKEAKEQKSGKFFSFLLPKSLVWNQENASIKPT